MMKLIQKILSHGLLIAIIVAAYFVYTKRNELFPQWFKAAEAQAEQTSKENPSASVDQTMSDISERGTTQLPPEPSKNMPGEEPEVVPVQPLTEVEVKKLPEQVETPDTGGAEVPTTEAVIHSESGFVVTQPGSGEPPVAPVPPRAAGKPDTAIDEQLELARLQYWQRDIRGAADAYRTLSEAYPNNPDVWGEMGNLYFSLRQREPAGAAYARCAELLIEQGEQLRARQLLNILYYLGVPEARKLEIRMQQTGS